jgi:hypothetical protein
LRALARRRKRGIGRALVSRGVSRDSVTLAAAIVSATAGIVLAAGGAVREPRLWLLVPLLGLSRLVLDALSDELER